MHGPLFDLVNQLRIKGNGFKPREFARAKRTALSAQSQSFASTIWQCTDLAEVLNSR
jgi:hypothetical protein